MSPETARVADLRDADHLLNLWDDLAEFRTASDAMKKGDGAGLLYGVSRGMDAFALAALFRRFGGSLLVICDNIKEAGRMRTDLCAWLREEEVSFLPPLEVLPHPEALRNLDPVAERLSSLQRLLSGRPVVVVAPVESLERHLPPRAVMKRAFFSLTRGDDCDRDILVRRLDEMGYRREEMVAEPGQFAVRGGIVDIFAPGLSLPVRIEFFGESVDSLRIFDPGTQRSVDSTDRVQLGPAQETFPGAGDLEQEEGLSLLEAEMTQTVRHLRDEGEDRAADLLQERIREQLAHLRSGLQYDNFDLFLPYFCSSLDTVFDYLPDEAAVAVWDPAAVTRAVEERTEKLLQRQRRLVAEGVVLPGQLDLVLPAEQIDPLPDGRPRLYLSALLQRVKGVSFDHVVHIGGRPSEPFYGQWEMFLAELRRYRSDGRRVVLAVASENRALRLADSLRQREFEVANGLAVVRAELSHGFEVYGQNLVVLTEEDVFGRPQRVKYQVPKKHRREVADYEDLLEGDYVVHRHHGIGKYLGLSSKEVQGVERDYLVISYAEGDRLYVPVDAIDLVQKYVGREGRPPRIYRLGSGEWNRAKRRVRRSLRDMAEELLRLYQARQAVEGHAFGPDTPWQREFEDAFPYEETPDQVQTSERIKRGMQRRQPMDHLLCGDVGYGKTEVALRAAFKAMMDGKQVAFLVPTTILAQQHFQTARGRFSEWPCRVDVLSRFRSRLEQEKVITALRRGDLDMVVGTHRLLQEDVQFRDLGLVIVDEEHRFGVEDKERLKQLKHTVDVLTLTATPIPRTLHMALSGIRDMSVIETPPEDRLPVATYVLEYDDALVADAIRRELDRGGQVFYVHNRVRSIERVRRRVQRLVPEATVAVAHGQMAEKGLEAVMDGFVQGGYDVLVCTTIIESGLDIPNANTLIVENADHLGLAQLYQLRGRVGRSDRLAYCYLTYRSGEVLRSLASERLSALKEFTELGSGFRLAKRDLELRGAGNVLGGEQHGFMIAVGFDLYTRMLREEVEDLRGERRPPVQSPALEMNVDAYLPEDYVPSSAQRVTMYRRMSAVGDLKEVEDITDELIDRFGDPPPPVVNLLHLAGLKLLGAECGVLSFTERGGAVTLELIPEEGDAGQWRNLAEQFGFRCSVSRVRRQKNLRVQLRPQSGSGSGSLLSRLQGMLRRVALAATGR
ncbi:MAG: transcription-repair coupling factor [Bacillota bacterium]